MKAKKVRKLLEPICELAHNIVGGLESVYEPNESLSKKDVRNHLEAYRISMIEHTNAVFCDIERLAEELQKKQKKQEKERAKLRDQMMDETGQSPIYTK